jgi:hypothetical protein
MAVTGGLGGVLILAALKPRYTPEMTTKIINIGKKNFFSIFLKAQTGALILLKAPVLSSSFSYCDPPKPVAGAALGVVTREGTGVTVGLILTVGVGVIVVVGLVVTVAVGVGVSVGV